MPYEGEHRDAAVSADASNRVIRTLVQGVITSFLLGAVTAIGGKVGTDTNLFDLSVLQMIGSSAVTAGVMAVVAYVMRRYMDQSSIPTPVPPSDKSPSA